MRQIVSLLMTVAVAGVFVSGACADDTKTEKSAKPDPPPVPLNKQGTVLLDAKNKRVLLKTKVVFREGVLEMLLCKTQTKEHESIVSIDSDAYVIHTGLLALGAKTGSPAQFTEDKFIPPTGTEIDIFVQWVDKKDNIHRMRAQKWIRHNTRRFYVFKMDPLPADLTIPEQTELRYDKFSKELLWYGNMTKPEKQKLLKLSKDKRYQKAIEQFYKDSQYREMKAKWVFVGSGFYVEQRGPDKGKRFYQAEGGDVICVANFASALLDVTAESSAGAESLVYEAYTERIPPFDTPVTVELVPVVKPTLKNEKK